MKEYKNGYLLTDEEHDKALKHRHVWVAENGATGFMATLQMSFCECGAMKMLTKYGWRTIISMSPNRGPRSLS